MISISSVISQCRSWSAVGLLSAGLSFAAVMPALANAETSAASDSSAEVASQAPTFLYQDNTGALQLSFDEVERLVEENTLILNNYTITNTGSETVDEAAYVRAFAWSTFDGVNIFSLAWDNDLDGWFTEDYDGNGNSLLVQMVSPSERIAMGEIADKTGSDPFPLTQPCSDSPSCLLGAPFPSVTQSADDAVPFISFGELAPGESATFDLAFLFEFEDGREGVLPLAGAEFTLNGLSAEDVPEPATAMAILVVGAGAIARGRRSAEA